MARGRGPLLVAVGVACAIGAVVLWVVAGRGAAPPPPTSPSVAPASAAEPAPSPVSPVAPPGAAAADLARARDARPGGPPQAPHPEEGLDAPAWRDAKVAFGLRELGAMAPYVRTGLDAARRDMEFCFRRGGGAAPDGRAADRDAPRPEPATLLLYLQAREGALDVVDTRAERLGTVPADVVECCREVLRGLEIPAFRAVPGRRYRLRYALE